MNIIEAIKSGKNFQRPCHDKYYTGLHSLGTEQVMLIYDGIPVVLSEDLFLANDWVIEEEKIEITKSQFIQAWIESAKETGIEHKHLYASIDEILSSSEMAGRVCKKLGFKD